MLETRVLLWKNMKWHKYLASRINSNKITWRRSQQFQGACIVPVACHLHRFICFPRMREFLANLIRVTPIIVVPTSRNSRNEIAVILGIYEWTDDIPSFALVKKFPRTVLWTSPSSLRRERKRKRDLNWSARCRVNSRLLQLPLYF